MRIFSFKRKIDADYRMNLELVNGEISKYLES
jgi:hypothetical protein